jgi:hypothetical protein
MIIIPDIELSHPRSRPAPGHHRSPGGCRALEPVHGGFDVDQTVVTDALAGDVVDIVVARYRHGGGGMLKTCGLWTSAPVGQPSAGLNFR